MDWGEVDPEIARRVVSEGHAYLEGQLKLALSADQRASVLAGVFTTAGTAVLAGLIAASTAPHLAPNLALQIYISGAFTAVMFFVGAIFANWSLFPVGFWLPGNQPKNWDEDIERGYPLLKCLMEDAKNLQEKIEENRTTIKKNSQRFLIGVWFGAMAPVVGVAVWLLLLLRC